MGDIISDGGLRKSVEATVEKRYGKILAAIFELKSVIEDLRMQMIGGIKCGLDIWELALVPSLINNAGTWVMVDNKTIDKLNSLQNTFLQVLLGAGRSCPRPALCWDTTTLLMDVRVKKAKLALLHHVQSLEDDCLAKEIYSEQLSAGWPGLVTECRDIIKEWDIPDIINQDQHISSKEWKRIIRQEAKIQNEKMLLEDISKKSKLSEMINETYELKPYLSEMKMNDARLNFALRSRMVKCKMNYFNDPKYRAEMWRCDSCRTCIDSQSHILYCPAYQKLREGKNLNSDQDVVTYFREVLRIRSELDLRK